MAVGEGYPREWLEEPDCRVIRHSESAALNKCNVACAISRILVGGEACWLTPPSPFCGPNYCLHLCSGFLHSFCAVLRHLHIYRPSKREIKIK